MSEKEICITIYHEDVALAKKQCPQGYHVEYTRRGYPLYVLDGYHYDIETDLCFKDKTSR